MYVLVCLFVHGRLYIDKMFDEQIISRKYSVEDRSRCLIGL